MSSSRFKKQAGKLVSFSPISGSHGELMVDIDQVIKNKHYLFSVLFPVTTISYTAAERSYELQAGSALLKKRVAELILFSSINTHRSIV